MSEKSVEMAMLFDFFGELLSEKQREYFTLYFDDDLSLSEIAENAGISRQGVRDAIVKAEAALLAYEEKTGVYKRFADMQRSIDELTEKAERLSELASTAEEKALAEDIAAGLCDLKG